MQIYTEMTRTRSMGSVRTSQETTPVKSQKKTIATEEEQRTDGQMLSEDTSTERRLPETYSSGSSNSPLLASARLKQLCPILEPCAIQSADHSVPFFSHTDDCVQVTPRVSLFDEKVDVSVHGLPSKAKVTLHLRTLQEWRKKPALFRSCGHFVASDEGGLDLNTDASVGGTYTGLDPAGLFWSMKPCPCGPQNIRMVVRNGDHPILYTLSVHLGHWSLNDLAAKDTTLQPLYSTTVTRLKKSCDVRRIPVKEGGVRGTLFLPSGDGPHPGVIDMFGSAGGLMETRAALLASHGFAVLALPYFRYQDLPDSMDDITFEYFEEAATWLSAHRAVKDKGIGVVAVSAGATIALTMAWKCPQVKAVVSINGPVFFYENGLNRKDGSVLKKGVKTDVHAVRHSSAVNGLCLRNGYKFNMDDLIPVWESPSHILMLVSDDDQQVQPSTADLCHSMYPQGRRHLMEVVHYAGAGHLLEPPYTPHCGSCLNPAVGMDISWGGNPVDHATAQDDSWKRIQTFLLMHLS